MRYQGFLVLVLALLLLVPLAGRAQKIKDTGKVADTATVKTRSPGRYALYSAVLPGLGQALNKKYWKIPIIYVGFGVMTYFLVTNTNYYLDYQCAYIEKTNGCTNGNYSELVNRYSEDQLLSAREYYRRNLEISILITTAWYALNILDAAVDAHLKTFDISPELSMKVGPAAIPLPNVPEPGAGIRLTLKF